MLDVAAEGLKPQLPLVPAPDRPRIRPAMVMQMDGSAVIYLEVVITPTEVDLMMSAVGIAQVQARMVGIDCAQALYDFVLRTRGTYLEGRQGK